MSTALIEHFERLAASAGGVAKLRELILSLAVRGKLVHQDPADEPASELLKKIRAEKDRLIAGGKIKRDKALPAISDDEKPYELPEGWEWRRFVDLVLTSDAGWSPSCDSIPREGNKWGVLKVSAVTWGEFRPEENKALPDHLDPRPECEVQAGDFLLSRANTEELVARSVVAWNPPARLMLSDKLIRLRLSELVSKNLFSVINNSACSRLHYIAKASGTSSSMKNVSREVILTLPVPVPPAAEQSRIVAKVEELMALCDRLAAEQDRAARVQGHWIESALGQLAESADADEFARHWQHLAEHFDTLFTTPESIDRLDATLLQLAVRGKLVHQDPADEPASELLKKIRAEKDRLIAEGKIKRDKPLSPIADDEKPYELPEGWEWVAINDVQKNIESAITDGPFGANLKSEHYINPGRHRVIRLQNIGRGEFISQHTAYISELHFNSLPKHHVEEGDIVVAGLVDEGVRSCIVPPGVCPALVKADCYRLAVHEELSTAYIAFFLNSPVAGLFATKHHHGLTLTRIGLGNFRSIPIPLPPLAEQSRIVAKVEELMALTASLKARLAAAQAKQAQLAEALIADALTC